MSKSDNKSKVKNKFTRTRVRTENKGESLTRQSEASQADVNNIVRKAMKTGQLPVLSRDAVNTELAQPESFHEAMNKVTAAQQAFDALPSNIRNEFDNDPVKFLSAVHDPASKEKLQELGILEQDSPPSPPAHLEKTTQVDSDVSTESSVDSAK